MGKLEIHLKKSGSAGHYLTAFIKVSFSCIKGLAVFLARGRLGGFNKTSWTSWGRRHIFIGACLSRGSSKDDIIILWQPWVPNGWEPLNLARSFKSTLRAIANYPQTPTKGRSSWSPRIIQHKLLLIQAKPPCGGNYVLPCGPQKPVKQHEVSRGPNMRSPFLGILAQAKPVRTDSFHWNFPNPMASTASSTMKVSGKERGRAEEGMRASRSYLHVKGPGAGQSTAKLSKGSTRYF